MSFFADPAVRRNPFPLYDQMRSRCPVQQVPGADIWVIFDYEGVNRTLNDPEVFSSRAAPPGDKPFDWLIFSDPPRHTKLRAIIMRAFTPRVVAGLEPRIRILAHELLNQALAQRDIDVAADFAVPLPIMVIAEMIGIPLADRPRFKQWSDAILGLSSTVSRGPETAQALQAYGAATEEMKTYLSDLLAQRRAAPTEDLLTRLVHAEVDGEHLTEKELLGFFQLLLLAGSETTTNLIGSAILCFLEHPDQLARVRASSDLLPMAIEEVLRYRAPVQAVFRQTKRDVEVHGQAIPAGKLVLAMIGSANRDPQQFANAGRFDITRDPNPHLAFGHGIHFCLGAALGRLEAKIALTEFLERVRSFQFAGTEPWEPRPVFHVHGPAHLRIRVD
jgi:cytochrome P450